MAANKVCGAGCSWCEQAMMRRVGRTGRSSLEKEKNGSVSAGRSRTITSGMGSEEPGRRGWERGLHSRTEFTNPDLRKLARRVELEAASELTRATLSMA